MSKPYTEEEVREMFLAHIRHLCRYWAGVERGDKKEILEGLAFSILNIFDGTTSLPAFDIVVRPHPDDKAHNESCDEDYFVDGQVINNCYLHEMFYKK